VRDSFFFLRKRKSVPPVKKKNRGYCSSSTLHFASLS
jgi:hypothetical protein